MNLASDTRIFILICCLLQGLAGLRLIKVTIPAYKLRGESAFLECQYELEKIVPEAETDSDTMDHNTRYGGGRIGARNYVDKSQDDEDEEQEMRRRMRILNQHNHQQQQQSQHKYQSQKGEPYYQPLVQAYQSQWQAGESSLPAATQATYTYQHKEQQKQYQSYYAQQYEQQQRQKQQRELEEQQYQYPYQTPKSPYGHSIYRGRTQTSSTTALQQQASQSAKQQHHHNNNKYMSGASGARVGASTYTGNTGGRQQSYYHHKTHNTDDSFADSNEREHNRENANNDEDEEEDDDEDEEEEDDEEEKITVDIHGRVSKTGGSSRSRSKSRKHDEHREELYAIKWYKDNEEFYRFVPKANPPKTSYKVEGVRVVEEHSDHARVLLRGLILNSTGLYRCEISAEAPNFSSAQGEGRLDVVYLPRDGPHIKGQQFQYQIGELLSLNCTSGKSHPSSHLQWFINEQPVVDNNYLIRYNDTVHRHGLITAMLGLELTVDARHFKDGAMRVKCLASISPILWKGGKESVLQRRNGIIDNREAMLLVRSSGYSLHCHMSVASLTSLRVVTMAVILMKLCQLLLLHTELT